MRSARDCRPAVRSSGDHWKAVRSSGDRRHAARGGTTERAPRGVDNVQGSGHVPLFWRPPASDGIPTCTAKIFTARRGVIPPTGKVHDARAAPDAAASGSARAGCPRPVSASVCRARVCSAMGREQSWAFERRCSCQCTITYRGGRVRVRSRLAEAVTVAGCRRVAGWAVKSGGTAY